MNILKSNNYPYPLRIPEGRYADFFVSLSSRPLSAVNITLHASDTHVSLAPLWFYFTPESWNSSQTLRIYAIHDSIVDSTASDQSTLYMALESDDYKFNGVSATPYAILLEDIDKGEQSSINLMLILNSQSEHWSTPPFLGRVHRLGPTMPTLNFWLKSLAVGPISLLFLGRRVSLIRASSILEMDHKAKSNLSPTFHHYQQHHCGMPLLESVINMRFLELQCLLSLLISSNVVAQRAFTITLEQIVASE